jgi:hypothetical protein
MWARQVKGAMGGSVGGVAQVWGSYVEIGGGVSGTLTQTTGILEKPSTQSGSSSSDTTTRWAVQWRSVRGVGRRRVQGYKGPGESDPGIQIIIQWKKMFLQERRESEEGAGLR